MGPSATGVLIFHGQDRLLGRSWVGVNVRLDRILEP